MNNKEKLSGVIETLILIEKLELSAHRGWLAGDRERRSKDKIHLLLHGRSLIEASDPDPDRPGTGPDPTTPYDEYTPTINPDQAIIEDRKSCPFCGVNNTRTVRYNGLWFVDCNSCTADGPEGDTKDEAVTLWNLRTQAKKIYTSPEDPKIAEQDPDRPETGPDPAPPYTGHRPKLSTSQTEKTEVTIPEMNKQIARNRLSRGIGDLSSPEWSMEKKIEMIAGILEDMALLLGVNCDNN